VSAPIDARLEAPIVAGGCHQAFERQAALTPHAVAVAFEGGELRYAELNRRANRLAHELRALGAARGRFVGIHLERSAEMLVAVLAVLKSGAAYLPLDPAYPAARLRRMLDDAAPAVLVTSERLAGTLPMHAARTVLIEHALARSARDENIDAGGTSADVAYLMYTSGSTGTPKGVLVTHGGVANYLAWRHSYFPLQTTDRVLQKASLSFDDSVWEILEPLSAGATVILARPRFEFDSAYLVTLIAQQRITAACFVPSLLRALVEEPGVGSCHSLRRLTTGGEALSVELQRRVLERLPGVALYNGYGATETTIASTFWQCVDTPGQSSVPIGRAIANTRVYVLDAQRQPVPPGVAGEIYISGAGVALGYFNRPALTAERFVQNPFSDTPDRIYRTGDLGRERPDGVLEFLGRVDEQVKVRGVRIELGEIESALVEHPRVCAAAAVCADSVSNARLLVAYIVAHDSKSPPASELREFLRSRLPLAMIPSRILAIAELPLTPSGKLDRQALATLAAAQKDDGGYVEPQNELERRLVEIWKQLLEVRPIGRSDDFFALGGDSLSAVHVAARMSQAFDRRFPPGLLFEAPTIELLARRLRADAAGGPRPSLVHFGAHGPARPLFLVHQIDGDVIHYRDLAHQMTGQRPVYGLQAPGVEDRATPLESIEVMAAHYLREIRGLQPAGPYALAGHSSGGLIAFEMAQQLCLVGERVDPLVILDIDAAVGQGRSLSDALRLHIETLRGLPATQRWAFLWRNVPKWIASVYERVRGSHAPPPPAANSDYSPVRLAMEQAVRAYRPKAYPGFVTLFRATDRSVTGTFGRTLGWKRLARGGIRVIAIDADHKTMLRGEAALVLAENLSACLERTAADAPTAGPVSAGARIG
jgi:amino acid adenylation domain-containing protein